MYWTIYMWWTRSMWCIVYRTCDICDGLIICIDAILVFVNYIFIVTIACNVPAFIYIIVVFILKNKEKRKKCANFAECLCKNTRQSGLFFFFFCFFFPLFFDINTTRIYINAGLITGSYNNKYIIDKYENSIDTNNESITYITSLIDNTSHRTSPIYKICPQDNVTS